MISVVFEDNVVFSCGCLIIFELFWKVHFYFLQVPIVHDFVCTVIVLHKSALQNELTKVILKPEFQPTNGNVFCVWGSKICSN